MVYFYLSTDFSFSVYDILIIAFTIAFVVISIWKFISLCKVITKDMFILEHLKKKKELYMLYIILYRIKVI